MSVTLVKDYLLTYCVASQEGHTFSLYHILQQHFPLNSFSVRYKLILVKFCIKMDVLNQNAPMWN